MGYVAILQVTRCGRPLRSLQASPSLFRFKYSRINVPNRNIQLNPTQLSTNPSYAFRLTSSKIPKYVPMPPQKNNGSRTAPGTLRPNCQLSAFGSSVCPHYPLDLLAPLRPRLLDDVHTLLAVFAHLGEDVSDPVALVLRTGWAVAPGCRRLQAVDIEKVRLPGDREAGVG
jgi:hypothetical protein